MSRFLLLLLLLLSIPGQAKHRYVYRNASDSSVNCYLLCFPDRDTARGLIVRDYGALPDMNRKSIYRIHGLALDSGFAILYTLSSPVFPELFYHDTLVHRMDSMVAEALRMIPVKGQTLLAGGSSASGTRALRYAQYCTEGKSVFEHRVSGVFAMDPPLDIERFYYSAKAIIKRNTGGPMLEEAHTVVPVFEQQLGGSPEQVPENYYRASVFSATDSSAVNGSSYLGIPILIFHEPDIDWWIKERSCGYYDINSYDIVAFVLQQKQMGNKRIELVTTTEKGFNAEGERKPHSWTIVDEDYLIAWLCRLAPSP